ncbi:MAG: hypothetical protein KUG77_27345 [Nannocystaceae bacterium]|nr:hypothetical protein [Nannocystaceae bacterium]
MLRVTQLLWAACVVSLPLLGACDSDARSKDGAAANAPTKQPPKTPVAELFPGQNVELPPPLSALKFGASEADTEAVLAGITTKLVDLDGYEDVMVGSFTTDRGSAKVLVNVRLSVPSQRNELRTTLTKKWGEPHEIKELSATVYTWFNPENGLRATLKDGFGDDNKDIEYSAYLPFESLIGTDTKAFGFETQPLLGMDLAGLGEHYGDVLQKRTKDRAQKKPASTDIHLLPTELESYTTTVWPTFDKSTGKIVAVRFTIPFEGEAGADERLMTAMKNAWGEPKEEEKYGKTRYVFSEDPFLVVEDSIGRAWEIEKRVRRD